jgi:hypothetical protein
MFQTLIVIASIVALSAAILTSTIVSAKNSFHQLVIAKTQTAMNDGTSQFQFWAQKFVAKYGTEADWQAQSAQPTPIFQPMCATNETKCTFYETLQWKVTGASSGVPAPASSSAPMSTAQNMTPAVDEQRVSATITTIVSDATGRTLYGGRTEEVTARVFNVAPFVVVTGTHDLSSSSMPKVQDSEGDSGGAPDNKLILFGGAPSVTDPSGYTSTIVKATIDCANTALFDQGNPEDSTDNGSRLFDPRFRSGGDLVWAYQMPCTPLYGVPQAPLGTPNYEAPVGSAYQIDASNATNVWQKGDTDSSTFVR